MKIVIAGANGQLGTELLRQLKAGGCTLGTLPEQISNAEVAHFDIDMLTITDYPALLAYLEHERPKAVVNCSAFTNVDACETNRQTAFEVNALGARNLARACEAVGAKLVHVSTDYVFAGNGAAPYCEYDLPAPASVYGKTKLAGEEYVKTFCKQYFIVRTAWLYGYAGNNFVKSILTTAKKNGALKVVSDQVGNPTNAEDLAYHLLLLCESEQYGTYHCTGEGICSWYEFACEIIRLAGLDVPVAPCTTEEFPRIAKRPAYSALENRMLAATGSNHMRPWQQALTVFFEHYKEA